MRNSFLLASFVFAVSLSLFAGYEALGSFTGTTTLTIKGTLPADMVEMLRNQEAGLELYKEKDTLTTPTTLQKGKNDYSFSEKKGRNISFKTKNGKFKWDEDPKDYLSFHKTTVVPSLICR